MGKLKNAFEKIFLRIKMNLLKCFFIFRVHVVFGRVISGAEIISHIENLPVDRLFRPLQDAKIINCGELVLKLKAKGIELFYI